MEYFATFGMTAVHSTDYILIFKMSGSSCWCRQGILGYTTSIRCQWKAQLIMCLHSLDEWQQFQGDLTLAAGVSFLCILETL